MRPPAASPLGLAPLDIEASEPPAPLGLVLFGLTFLLFNLNGAGLFTPNAPILAMGIFYGSVGQILVGMMEWRRGCAFGATAFISYGLFWLSLVALTILPRAGFGQLPQPAAMTAYLGVWGLFTAVLFLATFRLGRFLQVVFGALLLHLLLRTAGPAGLGQLADLLAGYEGILGGAAAVCAGIARTVGRGEGRSS